MFRMIKMPLTRRRERKMEERNSITGISQGDLRKLYRELRLTRFVSIISSLLAILLLLWGGTLISTIKDVEKETRPVMEKIAEVDIENLNASLKHVNETLESVDLDPIVQAIEELDVEGLNAAIDSLDMEELTKALKNLNDAADIFKQISQTLSQSLSPLTSLFK